MNKKVKIPTELFSKIENIETNLNKEFCYYIVHIIENHAPISIFEENDFSYVSL